MQVDLASFDIQRIERIKNLVAELHEGEERDSDWIVVSEALRFYEVELKRKLREKRGE